MTTLPTIRKLKFGVVGAVRVVDVVAVPGVVYAAVSYTHLTLPTKRIV